MLKSSVCIFVLLYFFPDNLLQQCKIDFVDLSVSPSWYSSCTVLNSTKSSFGRLAWIIFLRCHFNMGGATMGVFGSVHTLYGLSMLSGCNMSCLFCCFCWIRLC